MTMTLTFRGKQTSVFNPDGTLAYQYIKVPVLQRRHCDREQAMRNRRVGPYINSEFLPAVLKRELKRLGITALIRMDQVPNGVTITPENFLTKVEIDLDHGV